MRCFFLSVEAQCHFFPLDYHQLVPLLTHGQFVEMSSTYTYFFPASCLPDACYYSSARDVRLPDGLDGFEYIPGNA